MPSDHHSYHVRVGSMGELWHCAADESQYRRGDRVICRTPRGLEIGTVTAPGAAQNHPFDGRILRRTTTEDELLEARLLRYKQQAVESCREEIAARGLVATLIDVDHLFDGRTLIFYFLGEIDAQLQELSDALSERYEQRVRSKHFAKLLAEGCGPGCGTESRGGCGTSGGCAVCLAASACAKG